MNSDKYINTRIVYIKNNKILFEEIMNVLDINLFNINKNNKKIIKKYINDLKLIIANRMYILNADRFYIILNINNNKYNFKYDINIVKNIFNSIKGFSSYIVINNQNYTSIKNENGKLIISACHKIDNYNEESLMKQLKNNLIIGLDVIVEYDLVSLIYCMEHSKKFSLICLLDKNNVIKVMQDIPKSIINKSNIIIIKALFKKYKKIFAGNKIVLITDNSVIFKKSKYLVDENIILGCIGYLEFDQNVIYFDRYKKNYNEERFYLNNSYNMNNSIRKGKEGILEYELCNNM